MINKKEYHVVCAKWGLIIIIIILLVVFSYLFGALSNVDGLHIPVEISKNETLLVNKYYFDGMDTLLVCDCDSTSIIYTTIQGSPPKTISPEEYCEYVYGTIVQVRRSRG